jgi:hypothetical protein
MKEAVALSLLLLCWPSRPQSVTTVSIFAIEPCQMNFTINPSSGAQEMTSCVYSLPGTDLTASDWPTCYLWCCPGLLQPVNNTYDDLQSCISTYSQQPFVRSPPQSWSRSSAFSSASSSSSFSSASLAAAGKGPVTQQGRSLSAHEVGDKGKVRG